MVENLKRGDEGWPIDFITLPPKISNDSMGYPVVDYEAMQSKRGDRNWPIDFITLPIKITNNSGGYPVVDYSAMQHREEEEE
jgi:hypothetical protein